MIIFLCFLGILIDYFDRSALAYAITPLQQAFHLNNIDFGLIGSAFGVGYFFTTPLGGLLVDKWGARKIWGGTALLWSFACGLISIATGFWTLFVCRSLLGISEAPVFPALMRVAVDWLPVKKRARFLSMGLAAVPFASVIGASLISVLILHVGWRWMFLILGALGLSWSILWYVLFRDIPVKPIIEPKTHLKTSWQFLLFNPALLANNIAFFTFGYVLFFALVWLPGYYEQVYHIKLHNIPLFVTLPWLLGTLFVIAGGILSDWVWKKTHSIRAARSHQIWICQLLSAGCFIPVIIWGHSLMISLIFISLGIGIGLMPNAAFYALNGDLTPDKAGTSLGIMDAFFALAGIISPVLTGLLSHLTGNFNAAFLLLILLSVISALGVFLFQHEKALQ